MSSDDGGSSDGGDGRDTGGGRGNGGGDGGDQARRGVYLMVGSPVPHVGCALAGGRMQWGLILFFF